MSKRAILGGAATALAAAGLGAFAATGFGGEDQAEHSQPVSAGAVKLEAAGDASARATAARRAGRRTPVITHLITTQPVDAPAGQSTFAPLSCPRGTGQPITGGVITNGAADVAADVLSRFNPNTFRAPRNRFFVGVRNDSVDPETFRATLVCGKKLRIR